ncbi:MAG: hypothetical protein NUW01_12935 [Gemmatimonadaceae bacterium]|nr:hypothetical protein [Gemmatimonadaceae bacterium]
MGVTRFPDGIDVGSEAGVAAELQVGGTAYNVVSASSAGVKVGSLAGTAITGGGTIAPSSFGLTTVTAIVAGLGGTSAFAGTASTLPAYVKGNVVGGSAAVRVYDATGAEATAAGTIAIIAIGT